MYTYTYNVGGFEQGTISSNGNSDSTTVIRTAYIQCPNNPGRVKITAVSTSGKGVKIDFLGYKDSSTTSPLCDLYWYDSPYEFDISSYKNISHFRLCLKYSDGSVITPDDISECSLIVDFAWTMGPNGKPTNEYISDLPEDPLTQPYPKTMWRISPNMNEGKPYHDYLPIDAVLAPSKIRRNNYITIYDSMTPQDQFYTHGLGVLHPISCTVYETLNGEWTADIEHPIDSDGKWSYIQKFNILKILGQLFVIRVVDDSTINTRGTVKAHAEHIFYVLNDYLLPKGRSFFRPRDAKRYIEIAMAVAKEAHFDGATDYEFIYEVPYDLAMSPDFINKWGISTPQSLNISELIMGSGMILENTNTQIYRDNFFFSIGERKATTKDDAFEIRFGLNAKGINRTIDVSTVCTWLRGYTGDGSEFTISYDEASTLRYAPHAIRKEKNFQVNSMSELSRKTTEEFNRNRTPLESYSIDLYDATNSPDFEEFTNKADYTVGNRGIIIDKVRNSKVEVEVTSTVRDGITGNYITVQFGSLRGYIGGNYQSVIEPVGDVAIESYIQVKDSNNDFCYDSDDNRIVQDITESEVSYYG